VRSSGHSRKHGPDYGGPRVRISPSGGESITNLTFGGAARRASIQLLSTIFVARLVLRAKRAGIPASAELTLATSRRAAPAISNGLAPPIAYRRVSLRTKIDTESLTTHGFIRE
jgi:hypothetical protein